MSEAFKFIRSEAGGPLVQLHVARAQLPGDGVVSVMVNKRGAGVMLSMHASMGGSSMNFTADQARSVAAELLAAADLSDTGEAGQKGRH